MHLIGASSATKAKGSMNIEINPHSLGKMYLRHLYDNLSCLPSGTPTEWDKKLKEFDPELSLRFGLVSKRFLIFYNHHGALSTIDSFAQNESFREAFARVRFNSTLNKRALKKLRKDINDAEQKRQAYDIDQCGEEIGIEVYHGTRRRLINDNVDAFAPEKPSLGGVML